jgi:hypothetical protein
MLLEAHELPRSKGRDIRFFFEKSVVGQEIIDTAPPSGGKKSP